MDDVEKKALHKKLKRYLVRKGIGEFIWFVTSEDYAESLDLDDLVDSIVRSIEDNLHGRSV